MSNALEKKGNVRNFRSLYYENLGLRGVEQRKALELLLKDDEIGKKNNFVFGLQSQTMTSISLCEYYFKS